MANQDQIEILKQGVEVWNKWRIDNPHTEIDLIEADLRKTYLFKANLSKAQLTRTNFEDANVREANLREAYLFKARLTKTDLFNTDLSGADLRQANLYKSHLFMANLAKADFTEADLSETDLKGTSLRDAKLCGAILREADLVRANFSRTDLKFANLEISFMGGTLFTDVDLSHVVGLETIQHYGASNLDTNTLSLSRGEIPEIFLRGCGLRDWEIEAAKLYDPSLTNQTMDEILYKVHDIRAYQPIQISPLFISYSHADSDFVDKLEGLLNEKGVRFWRDIHHATAGKLEKQVDRAIRHNPTVLVVLSKNSIKSDWVQHEVRLARELEKQTGRDTLCPVALDDSWKNSRWPERIMEQVLEYNILNFSNWKDDVNFKLVFTKLISGLNLFYVKE